MNASSAFNELSFTVLALNHKKTVSDIRKLFTVNNCTTKAENMPG